uniref:Uncharacterized protein n=1 Tax=Rangifer tarandus platyrhynchus TaxID=3082113 RepID=A0ACB0FE34_RANTA|nr:unnamed protein product [Rangifer tarandus platyrhynchus]
MFWLTQHLSLEEVSLLGLHYVFNFRFWHTRASVIIGAGTPPSVPTQRTAKVGGGGRIATTQPGGLAALETRNSPRATPQRCFSGFANLETVYCCQIEPEAEWLGTPVLRAGGINLTAGPGAQRARTRELGARARVGVGPRILEGALHPSRGLGRRGLALLEGWQLRSRWKHSEEGRDTASPRDGVGNSGRNRSQRHWPDGAAGRLLTRESATQTQTHCWWVIGIIWNYKSDGYSRQSRCAPPGKEEVGHQYMERLEREEAPPELQGIRNGCRVSSGLGMVGGGGWPDVQIQRSGLTWPAFGGSMLEAGGCRALERCRWPAPQPLTEGTGRPHPALGPPAPRQGAGPSEGLWPRA